MSDLRKAAEMAIKCYAARENIKLSKAMQTLELALAQPEKKSKLNWFPAPTKIEWGESMVCTTVEIDADHYFDVFSEECQKENVELMLGFTKREWVGLSRDEVDYCFEQCVVRKFSQDGVEDSYVSIYKAAEAIEAALKEKNT